MKKTITLALGIIICLSLIITGCTVTTEPDEEPIDGGHGVGLANPMTYHDSAEEVENAVGVRLNVPDGAENVAYLSISGTIGQADFKLDGKEFTLRGSNSLSGTSLHGVYGETTKTEERTLETGVDITVSQLSETYYVAEWEKDGTFYSLSMSAESDDVLVNFFDLAAAAELITK